MSEPEKKSWSVGDHIDYEEVKKKSNDIKDEVAEFIRQNPLGSVALAAAIGLLLGRLLSSRKD